LRKYRFFAFWRQTDRLADKQTDRQTDKQIDSSDALSRSRYRERRLNNRFSTDRRKQNSHGHGDVTVHRPNKAASKPCEQVVVDQFHIFIPSAPVMPTALLHLCA